MNNRVFVKAPRFYAPRAVRKKLCTQAVVEVDPVEVGGVNGGSEQRDECGNGLGMWEVISKPRVRANDVVLAIAVRHRRWEHRTDLLEVRTVAALAVLGAVLSSVVAEGVARSAAASNWNVRSIKVR